MNNVMNKILLICLFIMPTSVLFSQNYSVDNIPEELKKNAGSVVRFDQMIFNVESRSKAKLYQKYAITILHESHKNKAIFRQGYDKFSKINSIKIIIYDKNGKKVKNVSKSDILDLSSFSESALFADVRQKYYKPEYYKYPFTIEYSYVETINGILSFPSYYTLTDYDVSLENGEFTVNIPAELRYLSLNTDMEPKITQEDNDRTYIWNFKNIGPIRNEDYDLRLFDLIPIIKIAPSQFELDGYVGNAETWEEFGNWIYSLNEGRDILPTPTKIEINKLTEGTSSKREKIQLVYEYMQSKTRYVNVIIGIGGLQPLTAGEVEENGYGDCKALTNYTYSLLKIINIESYYAIIEAGDGARSIENEFPSHQFNHAILCVPDGNDTIWLECTSQRNPFGYVGTLIDGREALLIKINGSKLVRTPVLSINQSFRQRRAVINIDEQGNSTANIEKKYQGLYYDNKKGVYYLEGKRRMDRVRNNIHIKNFSLKDENYKITEYRSDHPYLIEDYSISADRYVKKLGSRLLFDINFFNTEITVPSSINKQESDIFIQRSYTKIDSLEFIIPDGYFIKSYPKSDTVITKYGEFYTNFKVEGNRLYYTRKQLVNKGKFPSDEYSDFRVYLKKISMSDKQKVLVMPIE